MDTAGDEEEHATLLFNYLHYLALKITGGVRDDVFLCMGKAVPGAPFAPHNSFPSLLTSHHTTRMLR